MNGLEKVFIPDNRLHNHADCTFAADTNFKPRVEQGIIKLLHAGTWSVIDTYVLAPMNLICIELIFFSILATNLTSVRLSFASRLSILRFLRQRTNGNPSLLSALRSCVARI